MTINTYAPSFLPDGSPPCVDAAARLRVARRVDGVRWTRCVRDASHTQAPLSGAYGRICNRLYTSTLCTRYQGNHTIREPVKNEAKEQYKRPLDRSHSVCSFISSLVNCPAQRVCTASRRCRCILASEPRPPSKAATRNQAKENEDASLAHRPPLNAPR